VPDKILFFFFPIARVREGEREHYCSNPDRESGTKKRESRRRAQGRGERTWGCDIVMARMREERVVREKQDCCKDKEREYDKYEDE
jgi:hypothetical protein